MVWISEERETFKMWHSSPWYNSGHNSGQYTFVETHRTLLHKERTLHTLILNHFGGHGIPE